MGIEFTADKVFTIDPETFKLCPTPMLVAFIDAEHFEYLQIETVRWPVETNTKQGGSLRDGRGRNDPLALIGTTLRVYRYLYRAGSPCGIHDIQRGLGLSSSSVALYHVRKLLEAGLIKEETKGIEGKENPETRIIGYTVDRLILDNMIRIRRSLIPLQVAYAVFFATALGILLVLFRPNDLSLGYVFALIVIGIAIGIFSYQTIKTLSRESAI